MSQPSTDWDGADDILVGDKPAGETWFRVLKVLFAVAVYDSLLGYPTLCYEKFIDGSVM